MLVALRLVAGAGGDQGLLCNTLHHNSITRSQDLLPRNTAGESVALRRFLTEVSTLSSEGEQSSGGLQQGDSELCVLLSVRTAPAGAIAEDRPCWSWWRGCVAV